MKSDTVGFQISTAERKKKKKKKLSARGEETFPTFFITAERKLPARESRFVGWM